MKEIITDGNGATSLVAFKLSQVIPVYPITPSTPMAEDASKRACAGEKNLFGQEVKMVEMQSEAGVAGALHGALASGALSCTFTSSQGLLLMLPDMYKIAGEELPAVIHVAARSVATHALNIFGDHSDVMSVRSAGFAMLCSSNVQEAHDMAIIAHMIAFAGCPVLHFFDGFRTSHELQKIQILEDDELKKLFPLSKVENLPFKKKALSPKNPMMHGTAQNPDVFFQNRIASILQTDKAAAFDEAAKKFYKLTGRNYSRSIIYGNKNAENLIVVLGAASDTLQEQLSKHPNSAIMSVKLFRPFKITIPSNIKKVCVLDKCKEDGALSPLALDIIAATKQQKADVKIYSGIYGLGGAELDNICAKAIFDNIESSSPKDDFTVGIIDDVSCSSLPLLKDCSNLESNGGISQIKIFGLGSDGSVSASKSTIKILGQTLGKNVQGYFEYDSKKSGSLTISHLRLSEEKILSRYLISTPDVVMISNYSFVSRYNCLEDLTHGGIVILNTIFTGEELSKVLPKSFVDSLKRANAKFYVINAQKIARDVGLKEKINIAMETALFVATGLIKKSEIKELMTQDIQKTFSRKGDAVVEKNLNAMNAAFSAISKVDIKSLVGKTMPEEQSKGDFYDRIMRPIAKLQGNTLPVSAFEPSGALENGTSKLEKRGIALNLPKWIKENCIQCGQCVLACPHSALRALLVSDTDATEDFADAIGIAGAKYKIQLSPLDCTGCGVCAKNCPALNKALALVEAEEILQEEKEKQEKYYNLPLLKQEVFPTDFAKGLQFKKSYFEYPGACAGCGETPYIKLATMLFGDHMIIANATGCSSIYSASYPSCAFTKDENGCGPAWANSLFEDNAEFGLGLRLGSRYNGNEKSSIWIIGGDGWAYDIGYGGLDHVLSSGEDINILVLDNESYSNTGGQCSKATPMGASVKLAENGRRAHKKDLGAIAMNYENVYVAHVSLGANMTQCIKAFKEADAHKGVSLIIAYSPCVNQGFDLSNMTAAQRDAVQSGYFPLYRYDGQKLTLDSSVTADYMEFLKSESRYSLTLKRPDGEKLLEENKAHAMRVFDKLTLLSSPKKP